MDENSIHSTMHRNLSCKHGKPNKTCAQKTKYCVANMHGHMYENLYSCELFVLTKSCPVRLIQLPDGQVCMLSMECVNRSNFLMCVETFSVELLFAHT